MDLTHAFVRQLLEIVVQPSKPGSASYSPKVVQSLLRRQVVTWGMLDGNLLSLLRLRKDWVSAYLAISSVQ